MFALKSNPNSLEAFLNISLFLLTEHTKAFLGAEEGLILLLLDTCYDPLSFGVGNEWNFKVLEHCRCLS